MTTHCPRCRKAYGWFDRLSQPTMCSTCDTITNPDPFSATAEFFPNGEADLPRPDPLRNQSRGTILRRKGVKLMLIGFGATIVVGALAAIAVAENFHPHIGVALFFLGPVQLLRGAYLYFVSGRRLERLESERRI